MLVAAFLAVFVGGLGYSRYSGNAPLPEPMPLRQAPVVELDRGNPHGFRCDGRTTCSQMTSCAEAEYFLAHCPGTRMDGNGDGEPCEQQWCN